MALTGTLVAITVLSGLAMRVGHLSPTNLVGPEAYNSLFVVHGTPTLALLPALLLLMSEFGTADYRAGVWLERSNAVAWLAWLGLCFSGAGFIAVVVGNLDGYPSARAISLVTAAGVSATTLVAVCLVVRMPLSGWRTGAIALAVGSFVHMLGVGLATVAMDRGLSVFPYELIDVQRTFSGLSSGVLSLAAVASVLDRPHREVGRSFGVLIGVLFATMAWSRFVATAGTFVKLVEFSAGAWVGARSFRALGFRGADSGDGLFGALAALTWFEALAAKQILSAMSHEVHLYDTYFVVGIFHLEVVTAILAIVALLHRTSGERAAARRSRRSSLVGAVLSFVGSQSFLLALLLVGGRGMPRRYSNYLPEFQPFHVVASLGAFLLVAGVAAGLSGVPPRLAADTSRGEKTAPPTP